MYDYIIIEKKKKCLPEITNQEITPYAFRYNTGICAFPNSACLYAYFTSSVFKEKPNIFFIFFYHILHYKIYFSSSILLML